MAVAVATATARHRGDGRREHHHLRPFLSRRNAKGQNLWSTESKALARGAAQRWTAHFRLLPFCDGHGLLGFGGGGARVRIWLIVPCPAHAKQLTTDLECQRDRHCQSIWVGPKSFRCSPSPPGFGLSNEHNGLFERPRLMATAAVQPSIDQKSIESGRFQANTSRVAANWNRSRSNPCPTSIHRSDPPTRCPSPWRRAPRRRGC